MRQLQRYDVYNNDEILSSNITADELSDLIHINKKSLGTYVNREVLYKKRYKIVTHQDSADEMESTTEIKIPYDLQRKIDDILGAYKLLISGQGKIVTVNGKRYVKPIVIE